MVKSTQIQATPQIINALTQRLESALPKQATTGLQVVIQLLPQIEDYLEKGYSLTDVHTVFEDEGLECSYETFRRYFHKAKRLRDRQIPVPSSERGIAIESELVGTTEITLQPKSEILTNRAAIDSSNRIPLMEVEPSPAVIHAGTSDEIVEPSQSRQPQKPTHHHKTSNKQSNSSQSSPSATTGATSTTKASSTNVVVPDGQPPPERQELESQFPAFRTPRKTKSEKAKHFNQY